MRARPFAVVSGGGTGGHVFEALAIARALVDRGHPQGTIELVGSERGQESTLLAGEGFPVTLLPGRGIVRRMDPEAIVANAGALSGLVRATVRAVAALATRKPRVVVSVGGYASFPADVAAVVLGVPLVLVTIDAVPGLVHRLLARLAAANAVALPGTPLPRAVVTGVAVRDAITTVDRSPAGAVAARRALGIPTSRTTIGVMSGSLGARSVNEAVLELAGRWQGRQDLTLYHVTGRRDFDQLETRSAASANGDRGEVRVTEAATGAVSGAETVPGTALGLCYRMVPFCDRMDLLYAATDVMVCRAGAGTVAELTVAGVPAVLVPLPGAPGDHQTANARALVDAGAAVLVADERCSAATLAAVLDEMLEDPGRLTAMSAAALRLGRPDAAARVAEVVDAHAR
jgi:UDP-N-acetylglucosamine--N-acetylmuramyl-(pentapeptide) pyrophosphoryl-undecaprenol N-acetylglucosamine transferase